jgi:DDE family transposase
VNISGKLMSLEHQVHDYSEGWNQHRPDSVTARTKDQNEYLKRWKRSVSYGYRWVVETVFSSIKRTFAEHVTARKFPHMVTYNTFGTNAAFLLKVVGVVLIQS